MAAKVIIIGLEDLVRDISEMQRLMENPERVTKRLAASMRKFVHVRTGFLKSTIYHKGNVAGAKAPYAGIEEERGGPHAYATRAIKDFNMDRYADEIVEPF